MSYMRTTSMSNEISRRQEIAMADTHDPYFFSIAVSVQNPIDSFTIWSISFGEDTWHLVFAFPLWWLYVHVY